MKKITILIFIITLFGATKIYAAWSCQSNSKHLKEKYDTKKFHYVKDCNCPCHKYICSFVRGICPECGHYHDPDEVERLRILAKIELERKNNKYTKDKEYYLFEDMDTEE